MLLQDVAEMLLKQAAETPEEPEITFDPNPETPFTPVSTLTESQLKIGTLENQIRVKYFEAGNELTGLLKSCQETMQRKKNFIDWAESGLKVGFIDENDVKMLLSSKSEKFNLEIEKQRKQATNCIKDFTEFKSQITRKFFAIQADGFTLNYIKKFTAFLEDLNGDLMGIYEKFRGQ